MIEVLVTILIVTLGLLGIAALFVRSQQMGDEAYQRFQALHIAHQLAETLSANRAKDPAEYVTGTSSPAGIGGFDAGGLVGLADFHNELIGASKQSGGSNVATLIAAVGCVESLGAGTALDPLHYRISVAWQGRQASANPAGASSCGKIQIDNAETGLRRIVSLDVQVF